MLNLLFVLTIITFIGLGFKCTQTVKHNSFAPCLHHKYTISNPGPAPEPLGSTVSWGSPNSHPSMWDLFTPPQIEDTQKNGETFVDHPFYRKEMEDFGLIVTRIKQEPYRFQLEGWVEVQAEDYFLFIVDKETNTPLVVSTNKHDDGLPFNIKNIKTSSTSAQVMLWDKIFQKHILLSTQNTTRSPLYSIEYTHPSCPDVTQSTTTPEVPFLCGEHLYQVNAVNTKNGVASLIRLSENPKTFSYYNLCEEES